MTYFGDISLGDTIDLKFTTVDTNGAPTTLSGTPAIAAYPGNSVTEIAAGITLTVDFDARTGLNNVRIVATGANGYATATDYTVVITTGTVGGTSVVGYVVGSFSIEKRSALRPAVAGRTLGVAADGDLIEVNTLTGHTAQTGDSFARLGAPAGASVSADIAAIEAQTDDIGVAGAGLTAIPWNAAWDAEVQSEVADALDVAVPATPTANSINERIKTVDDADIPARLPAALDTGRIIAKAEVVADKTGYSVGTGGIAAAAFAAGAIDAAALAAGAGQEIADEILNRDLAGGASGGTRNVRNALRALRNKVAIAAGTATVYEENDTTAAWTAAVVTTAGDPISSVDPV